MSLTRRLLVSCFTLVLLAVPLAAFAQVSDSVRQTLAEKARMRSLGSARTEPFQNTSPTGAIAWRQAFENGDVLIVPGRGTIVMSTNMLRAYRGDPNAALSHTLGFPITDELGCRTPDPNDRYQVFERGVIFWRAATGRGTVHQGMAAPSPAGNCVVPGPTATVVTAPASAPRQHYRVTILGFAAEQQTSDDPWNLDGKGDEVYVNAQVIKFAPNGTILSYTSDRSVLMGDVNERPASEERVLAGSASDQGGIVSGSAYRPGTAARRTYSHPTLPWVVFDGELAQGTDAVMVIPTIWEWDDKDTTRVYSYENFYFKRPYFAFFQKPLPILSQQHHGDPATPVGRSWVQQLISQSLAAPGGIAPTSVWGQGPVIQFPGNATFLDRTGDQPIGLSVPAEGSVERTRNLRSFVPQIVFLTAPLAHTAATTVYPLPALPAPSDGTTVSDPLVSRPGIVALRYRGGDSSSGNYILYVRIEEVR